MDAEREIMAWSVPARCGGDYTPTEN